MLLYRIICILANTDRKRFDRISAFVIIIFALRADHSYNLMLDTRKHAHTRACHHPIGADAPCATICHEFLDPAVIARAFLGQARRYINGAPNQPASASRRASAASSVRSSMDADHFQLRIGADPPGEIWGNSAALRFTPSWGNIRNRRYRSEGDDTNPIRKTHRWASVSMRRVIARLEAMIHAAAWR
jgi:hypothetical protein